MIRIDSIWLATEPMDMRADRYHDDGKLSDTIKNIS